jgi:carboxypeptidase Q
MDLHTLCCHRPLGPGPLKFQSECVEMNFLSFCVAGSAALFLWGAQAAPIASAAEPLSVTDASDAPPLSTDLLALRDQAEAIYLAAQDRDLALRNLEFLTDQIGHRLSGSASLERAVEWAATSMAEGGLLVDKQPVQVPHWVRGEESATLLSPVSRDLNILGLGMTVGGDVEADVVVLTGFEALETTDVAGKIVLFNVPFTTYGETVQFRLKGASLAASHGAVGMLLRSVTTESLYTPHTGTLKYDAAQPKIPAAALSIEDATWLHRLYKQNVPIRVRLSLGAKHHGLVQSHNVIADYPGSDLAKEAVLVGCHLDSWDVGQGAQDDGVGCMIAWEAAQLLKDMGIQPRRTIRVVLFTAEENGIWGGNAYAEERFEEFKLVAALESDSGNGIADGFRLDLSGFESEAEKEAIHARAVAFETALRPAGLVRLQLGYSGADVRPSVAKGVPGFGLNHDTTAYWPIHHTDGDTFEKVIPADLAHNVGLMAAAVYVLAQAEWTLVGD